MSFSRHAELRRLRPLLGCYVEIGVLGQVAPVHAHACITRAFAQVERMQRLLSFHEADSDLSRLNRAGGLQVSLHPLAARVLRLARRVMRASDGVFNCTVGGALMRRGRLPKIVSTPVLAVGSADDIWLRGRRAKLLRPVLITLDGIAKGYAVDLAVASLRRDGIDAGWVNAGGDLRVFGGIRLPIHRRELNGRLMPIGELECGAIATSRAGGAFDPRYPGTLVGERTGWHTARLCTVLARRAWLADALTKVAALGTPADRRVIFERCGAYLLVRR